MRNFFVGGILSLAFLVGYIADLNAWALPETGQFKCFNNGTEIACPQPGEAFYGQDAQYNTGERSFTKLDSNGNDLLDVAVSWSMVRDNVTGLTWELKTDDATIHDKDNEYPLVESQEVFINTLNADAFGGFADWRLPTLKELSYLLDRGRSHPSVDTDYFLYTHLYYWSSTAAAPGSVQPGSYYVQFDDGYEYNYSKDGGGAMAVRGDSSASDNLLEDNGDGTIIDNQTRLTWQQSFPSEVMNWEESLAYCENLELAGSTDWRLPNVYELQSIVDYTTDSPCVNTDYFPLTEKAYFKTSTTIDIDFFKAWVLDFNTGYVDYYFASKKVDSHYVRCVRSEHCAASGDSDSDGECDTSDADTVYGTISGDIQAGVTVEIYRTTCGADVLIATTTTDQNGYYSFGDLESGNLLVVPTVSGYSFVPVRSWPVIPQTVIQPYGFTAIAD